MSITKKRTGAIVGLILILGIVAFTLTACFSSGIVITLNTNGGTACDPITVSEENDSITLPTPTKEGYVFGGWYSDRSLSTEVSSTLTGDAIPKQSCTYYAKWTVQNITVTFTANGETVETKVVKYGTQIKVGDFPSLADYPDYEWTTEQFIANYDRTVAATLRQDIDDPTYKVSYFVYDNAEQKYKTFASYSGYAGVSIEVPATPSAPDDGKDYYFKGWFYDTDGKTACKNLPDSVGTEDVSLYAVFVEIGDDSQYLYYEETSSHDGIIITGLTAIGQYQLSISIPSEINGKPVLAIGYENSAKTVSELNVFKTAFVQTVILPQTVTLIGDWAFYGCTSLNRVVFGGDKISYIGKGAFANCVSLVDVTLPNNLTGIGDYAFAGITNDVNAEGETVELDEEALGTVQSAGQWKQTAMSLEKVEVGNNSKLSTIGDYAFFGCTHLATVKLSKAMRDFNYLAFCGSGIQDVSFYQGGFLTGINGAVYSANGKILYYYPTNASPTYVMPSAVTAVAANAFNGNENITSVTIAEQVTSIGDGAFFNCVELSDVTFNTTILTSVGNYAFYQCKELVSVTMPISLTTLGEYAFYGCEKLVTVQFNGNALSSIKKHTFDACVGLESFNVPSNVDSIGEYAFFGCKKLGALRFKAFDKLLTVDKYAFADCVTVSETTLPSSITYIGEYAFAGISGKMALEISDDTSLSEVTYYGDYAFYNTSISKFTISTRVANNDSLGKYVFKNCTLLRRVSFSYTTNYDTVPEGLFYGCTAIEQVAFTNNVTAVEDKAFFGCSKLAEVTFNNVSVIGESAFENCIALTNQGDTKRILSPNITVVGERAFFNCAKITSITVPSGLTSLPEYAFANCVALTDIYYDTGCTLTTIGNNCFAYCTSLETAQLPITLALRDEDDTCGLVKNPFYGCSKLKNYSFGGTNVNGLTVSDGIVYRPLSTTIGDESAERAIYAYPTSKSFASVAIPADVSVIDRYAFFGSAVSGVTFNKNAIVGSTEHVVLIKIGDYAFAESKVATANISYRVYDIGNNSFENSALSTLTFDGTYVYDGMANYAIANECVELTNNLLTVGSKAFANTGISHVVIPARAKIIGDGAFSDDYKLSSLKFSGGELTELSIGESAFKNDSRLLDVDLPANLTVLGDNAFSYCVNIKTIAFANGTSDLSIGEGAFSYIHYLYEIALPNNLVSMGNGIFRGDSRLKYVSFGASEERLNGALALPADAFCGVNAMESIVIPSYITVIGENAFLRTEISSITFESGGTGDLIIQDGAFAKTSKLTSIELPATLSKIGNGAFLDSALKNIDFGTITKDFTLGDSAFRNTKLTAVSLNSYVTSIGKYCFADTITLESFVTNGGITEISEGAFENCVRLNTVTIDENITTIGDRAFFASGITALDSSSVTMIGKNAFCKSSIANLNLDVDGDVTIKEGAFESAIALKDVNITVTGTLTVEKFGFGACSLLSTLNLTAETATLAAGFAYNLTSLADGFVLNETDAAAANYYYDSEEKVLYSADKTEFIFYPAAKTGSVFMLGENVITINDYAFYGNATLRSVVINNDGVAGREEHSFAETDAKLMFYVGATYVELYKNQWGTDNVTAYSIVGDGFVLTLQNSGKYYISGYLGNNENIVINDSITVGETVYEITGIAENAFMNNTVIKTVDIRNGVKLIGNSAFRNCSELTSVKIGENVTGVKNYAFYNCAKLATVEFATEGSLISIGNYAFSLDVVLTSVNIPSSVETIGIFAFAKDELLGEVIFNDGLISIGNNAFEACDELVTITLPQSLRSIGSYVFSRCSKLIYVALESTTVPNIESNTFSGVIDGIYFFVPALAEKAYKVDSIWRTYITKIISVDNICSIENYGKYVIENTDFDNYKLLAYIGTNEDVVVTIESAINDDIHITDIGEYAFGQFVTEVTISEGIQKIEGRAFAYASALTTINLPASLVTIGEYAFANLYNLSAVNIASGSNLATIGDYVFFNCFGLTEINLPASLKSIGAYAFSSDSDKNMNLESVIFEHNSIASKTDVSVKIGAYAFAGNDKLVSLDFNCYVSGLGAGAFNNCTKLESIYLNYQGENLAQVKDESLTPADANSTDIFGNCNKLSIIVPTEAFVSRYKNFWRYTYDINRILSKAYVITEEPYGDFAYSIVSTTNKTVTVVNYLGTANSVEFPSSVVIGKDVYAVVRIGRENNNNSNIVNGYVIGDNVTSVIIPNTIKIIGADAFRGSKNLTTVTVIDVTGQISALEKIEAYAFAGCKKLVSINIPKTVKDIESHAFADCTMLNDGLSFTEYAVPLSDPTLRIGSYAFSGCVGMTVVTFPNQLASIGDRAFENCTMLSDVEFSNDSEVESLGAYVFSHTAIKEITIPASVQTVYNYAFDSCQNLTCVYLLRETDDDKGIGTLTTAYKNIFNNINNPHIKVYVPLSAYSAYSNANGWREKTVLENLITDDKQYAYKINENNTTITLTSYRGNAKELVIPRKINIGGNDYIITTLAKYFANTTVEKISCESGSGITAVNAYAFSGCYKLREVHLPDTVTTIGEYAFENCYELTDIKLPKSLTDVNQYTFLNCTSLREITVPDGVYTLGNAAFYGCTHLTRVIIKFTTVNALGSMVFDGADENLCIVVPELRSGMFVSQWLDVAKKIYSDAYLIGDFIVEYVNNGESLKLIQYTGQEEVIDFTELRLLGLKITEIEKFAIGNDVTKIIVDEDIVFSDDMTDRIIAN